MEEVPVDFTARAAALGSLPLCRMLNPALLQSECRDEHDAAIISL